MAFGQAIGGWTPAELRRFVINLLQDPGALPKSVSGPSQQLPGNAADGDVPVWNAATNSWTTSTQKPVTASELSGFPNDISKVLLGDGSWAGGMRKFFDSTLGGTTATFDVTNIPAGAALLVFINGRSDTAATGATVLARPNNDATAVYYNQLMSAASTTQTDADGTAATAARIGRITAATAVANEFGSAVAIIPNYSGTTGTKVLLGLGFSTGAHSAGANNTVEVDGSTWSSTAAITRLVLLPGAGSWVTGSRCVVHILG